MGEDDAQVADVGSGRAGAEQRAAPVEEGGAVVGGERGPGAAGGGGAVEEGAGGIALAVYAVRIGGEAGEAAGALEGERSGERIFLVRTAPAGPGERDDQLAAGDQRLARRQPSGERSMLAADPPGLA